jgi:hypothetical protein
MNFLGKKWSIFLVVGAAAMIGKNNGVAAKLKKKKNVRILGNDFFI